MNTNKIGYVFAIDGLNRVEFAKFDWLNDEVDGEPNTSSYDGGASM